MPVRYGLAAAAAACLVGGLAFAETPPSPDTSGPPAAGEAAAPADQGQPPAAPPPADQGQAPAAAPMAAPGDQAAPAATGPESSAQVAQPGTQVVASQPVPDTPDNRSKYGAPLSRAGKHTKAAGN